MNLLRSFLLVAGVFLAGNLSAKEVKVLTIGNSFADSAFQYLPSVAKSVPGCELVMERANIGGCSLQRHWNEFEKSEKNPAHKPYGRKMNLREKLTSQKWDIVTIQQASPLSWKPESYQPYADQLIQLIRKLAPQAEIVIQQTWAYRLDAPSLKNWNITQNEMYDRLTGNYKKLAEQYKFRIIPTGLAVQISRERTPEAERFKAYEPARFAEVKYPEKPSWLRDGDVVGKFYWGKNQKPNLDPIHLNDKGAYLQACVWFAFLFDKKTSDIKFAPKWMNAKEADFLRTCAQDAVNTFSQVK